MGEPASAEVRLSAVEDSLQDIKSQVKEIASRKVPWIPLIGIGLSFAVTIGAASVNSLVQVNLNADRIARNRESIERILEAQNQTNTRLSDEIRTLSIKVYQLKSNDEGTASKNKVKYASND